MKTLYVTDLDGTLLRSDDSVSDFSRQTLTAFIESGGLFTFATARSYSSLVRLRGIFRPRIPLVTYNGAFLVEPETGRPLHVESLPQDLVHSVWEAVRDLSASPLFYSLQEGREKVSYLEGRENPGLRRYIGSREGDPRMTPVTEEKSLLSGEIYYCTCIGEREELQKPYETLSHIPGLRVTLQQELYRPEYWLELMSEEATKARALLKLKERLACDRLVTFGDAINDLPMFAVSDEAYAVSNAVPELKCAATATVASNEEDGVARWVKEYGNVTP